MQGPEAVPRGLAEVRRGQEAFRALQVREDEMRQKNHTYY